jgi:hypothetical protein
LLGPCGAMAGHPIMSCYFEIVLECWARRGELDSMPESSNDPIITSVRGYYASNVFAFWRPHKSFAFAGPIPRAS